MLLKRTLPIAVAIATGFLTLFALLFKITVLSNLLLGWVTFLATTALVLGALNLFAVHLKRLFQAQNYYSGVLILGMLTVFGLALTDSFGLTSNGFDTLFAWIQAPLEAALASLLLFFLLFAGFGLLKRQRSGLRVLFLTTIVLILLAEALPAFTFVPAAVARPLQSVRFFLSNLVATAGMRALLIGIGLGTVTLSLRVLLGSERPYSE